VLIFGEVNAYPSFLNVFGEKASDGTLNIAPSWQNGIGAATNCGEVIGLQVSPPIEKQLKLSISLDCWVHVRTVGVPSDSHFCSGYDDWIYIHSILWYVSRIRVLRVSTDAV